MKRLLAILAASAVPLCVATLADEPPLGPVEDLTAGGVEDFVFRQEGTELLARVVEVRDFAPTCYVNRLLAVSPRGREVILTSVFDPRRGSYRTSLLDDRTSWWAEVELEYGITGRTTAEVLNRTLLAIEEGKEPETAAVRLRTSTGLSFAGVLDASYDAAHGAFQSVLAPFQDSGLARKVAASMPQGLDEALAFLDEVIQGYPHTEPGSESSSVGSSWRPVVHLLLGSLGERPAAQEGRRKWTEEEKRSRASYAIYEPELLEFLSQFRTPAEITDPLAGLRAEEGREGCPAAVPQEAAD